MDVRGATLWMLVFLVSGMENGPLGARADEGDGEVHIATDQDVQLSEAQETLRAQPPARKPGATPPAPSRAPPAPRDLPSDFTSLQEPPGRSLRRTDRRLGFRLASVPHMFGDSIGPDAQIQESEGGFEVVTDVPLFAASRTKLSDNNSPAAMERAYFTYQHFHNILQFDLDPSFGSRPVDRSLDRFVFGWEHLVLDGFTSLDLRLPLYSSMSFAGAPFGVDNGRLGNLMVAAKHMLLVTDASVLSAGLGVDFPTGGDSSLNFNSTEFTFVNRAFHFLPFVAFQTLPNDRCFLNGFLQMDAAAGGIPVQMTDPFFGSVTETGSFTEQNLLHVDLSGGYWLIQDSPGPFTGLAVLTELHYTTTLQDSDVINASSLFGLSATMLNQEGRQDVLNMTLGLHTVVLDDTAIRVGVVLPLRTADDRFFDSEFMVQVNRLF
jgi:hypothetical protein